MVIDAIIESIINVSKGDVGFKMNKEEWIEYLSESTYIGRYMERAMQAVQEEDWREFKIRMNEYMWKHAIGATWAYNQFNRLSLKKIGECIK